MGGLTQIEGIEFLVNSSCIEPRESGQSASSAACFMCRDAACNRGAAGI
jgi:hypothetical protein